MNENTMYAVEFEAVVHNGLIEIPAELRTTLSVSIVTNDAPANSRKRCTGKSTVVERESWVQFRAEIA